ncbi:uncharacterized protein L201_004025 [Kwoniella dendrophila CBS 6074]|uniref:F-box domain-containing protein n=1 Tax=Kwoniella dendrophila CBS 6074 TaxID=1295534 RepID=A0AAX4JUR8_9TREE
MLRLNQDILEKILLQLSIYDLIALSQVNKGFHNTIREIPSIQYRLYRKLYKCGEDEETFDPLHQPTKNILDLVQKERNLLNLIPRITRFSIKKQNVIHSIQDDYLITIPSVELIVEMKSASVCDRYQLCTIYKIGENHAKPKTLYVPFIVDYNTLLVDIKRDLMIIIEVSGLIRLIRFSQFYQTQFLDQCEQRQFDLPLDYGEHPEYKLKVAQDKIMIDLRESFWVANLDDDHHEFYRFPQNGNWESNHGSIITDQGLLIGLDIPEIPFVQNSRVKIASLAVFSFSGTLNVPYLPELLLEIPYTFSVLSKMIRKLRNIPKNVKIIISSKQQPKIHTNGNPSFIRISLQYHLWPSGPVEELNIVIPINQLSAIKIENKSKQWIKGRTWRRSSHPFDGIERIPFQKWKHRSHIWIEDITPKEPSMIKSEIQIGCKVFQIDNIALKHRGKLYLEITDFNHREVGNRKNEYGVLKDVKLDCVPDDGQRPNKPRSIPRHHSLLKKPSNDYLSGRFKSSGEFSLGLPKELDKVIVDEKGQKLIIQQTGDEKLWIIDFGV